MCKYLQIVTSMKKRVRTLVRNTDDESEKYLRHRADQVWSLVLDWTSMQRGSPQDMHFANSVTTDGYQVHLLFNKLGERVPAPKISSDTPIPVLDRDCWENTVVMAVDPNNNRVTASAIMPPEKVERMVAAMEEVRSTVRECVCVCVCVSVWCVFVTCIVLLTQC